MIPGTKKEIYLFLIFVQFGAETAVLPLADCIVFVLAGVLHLWQTERYKYCSYFGGSRILNNMSGMFLWMLNDYQI